MITQVGTALLTHQFSLSSIPPNFPGFSFLDNDAITVLNRFPFLWFCLRLDTTDTTHAITDIPASSLTPFAFGTGCLHTRTHTRTIVSLGLRGFYSSPARISQLAYFPEQPTYFVSWSISGRGIGFQSGFNSNGPPPGYGAPVAGNDRGGFGGGSGGGYGGGMKRDFDGGDDRDQKRVRY